MPFLERPMELRQAPGPIRRMLRALALVALTSLAFGLALAITVLSVTD